MSDDARARALPHRGGAYQNDKIAGIDLGTSTTLIAVCDDAGVPSALRTLPGEVLVDSCVSVHLSADRRFYVGQAALDNASNKKYSLLTDVKRLIGRRFYHSDVSELMRCNRLPYLVVPDECGNALVRIRPRNGAKFKDLLPQQVSAKVLDYVANAFRTAEHIDVETPVRAVVTIPANFLEPQRQATKEAAVIANIDVVRLVAEPTAAAIAYLHDKNVCGTYLVFDFGGGTLDVSVVAVSGRRFVVRATAGNTLLGGRDVDRVLYEHFAERIEQQGVVLRVSDGMNQVRRDEVAQRCARLRDKCTKLKCYLSMSEHVELHYGDLVDDAGDSDDDYNDDDDDDDDDGCAELAFMVSRGDVDELLHRDGFVSNMMAPVHEALRGAGVAADELNGVLLAGGTCRLPLVQQTIRAFFGKVPVEVHRELDHVGSITLAFVNHYLPFTHARLCQSRLASPLLPNTHSLFLLPFLRSFLYLTRLLRLVRHSLQTPSRRAKRGIATTMATAAAVVVVVVVAPAVRKTLS
jgi:molecular chaperone DnaK